MKVPPEKFIDVWLTAYQEGRNLAWVARELGIAETSARLRAQDMRKRGTNLPELAEYRRSETKRLNALIADRLGEQPKQTKR
jgi:hypothetical protein